jgi:hypothetical protein
MYVQVTELNERRKPQSYPIEKKVLSYLRTSINPMPKTCSGSTRPQNMRVQFRSWDASIDPFITGLSSAAARTSSPRTTRCSGRRIGHLHRAAHPIEPGRHDPKVERRQPHCCLPTSMRSTLWSPGCSGAVTLPIEP